MVWKEFFGDLLEKSLQKGEKFLSWQKNKTDKNRPMFFLRTLPTKYLLCLGALVAAMLVFTLFGGKGLLQIYHLREERERIHLSNARLQEENQRLTQQVQRLRYQKEEVEKIAREELGLVKKGEVIYQFER
jgi:cell division protein FtsB